jgi:hypothetical protein
VVNTPSDRDVGTVTEHPFAAAYELEVAACSLETEAEQLGSPPSIDIRRVLVAETRNATSPPPCYRTGCAGGQAVNHLNGMVNPTGATTVWGWQRHRYFALKAWMATKNDDDLIAILASGEVLFAGCNESTLREKYDLVVRADGVGGPIVMAAELSPLHPDLAYHYNSPLAVNNWSDHIETMRISHHNDAEIAVNSDWATSYATTPCTDGVCTVPPTYKFANPSFIMGPVGDIETMFEGMAEWADTDYRLINQWYLRNYDMVSLDFTGVLVMSLHNMHLTNLPVEVEDVAGSKRFKNKLSSTGASVCFVHGGGNSFPKLKEFAEAILA